jgi:hypothetical protein
MRNSSRFLLAAVVAGAAMLTSLSAQAFWGPFSFMNWGGWDDWGYPGYGWGYPGYGWGYPGYGWGGYPGYGWGYPAYGYGYGYPYGYGWGLPYAYPAVAAPAAPAAPATSSAK